MVFNVEAGELTSLTDADDPAEGPMYIGADWTADSAQVVFAAFHGLGHQAQPDALYRADRNGGDLVDIPLPSWSDSYSIYFPPQVAGDAVLVSIQSKGEAGGVWRVGLDGSDRSDGGVKRTGCGFGSARGGGGAGAALRQHRFRHRPAARAGGDVPHARPRVRRADAAGVGRDLGMVTFAPGDTGLMVRDDRLATIDPATGAAVPVANSPRSISG